MKDSEPENMLIHTQLILRIKSCTLADKMDFISPITRYAVAKCDVKTTLIDEEVCVVVPEGLKSLIKRLKEDGSLLPEPSQVLCLNSQ
jgi:hypothetical protein